MTRCSDILPAIALLSLAACSEVPRTSDGELSTIAGEERATVAPEAAPVAAPRPSPSSTRDKEEPADPDNAKTARQVLVRYFDLTASGRWADAADLWSNAEEATSLAARLRMLGDVRANIADPGRLEGAAGSLYTSISFQLLRGGRSVSDGTAVLRRANDVSGSTAEQRRWHIESIELQPPPVPIDGSAR